MPQCTHLAVRDSVERVCERAKKKGKRKQENETETETDRQEMLYKCSWPGAVAGRLAGVALTARSTCCLGGAAWWCWSWCLILVGVFDRVPNAFGVA